MFFYYSYCLSLKKYPYFFFNIDDGHVIQKIKHGGNIKGSNTFSDDYDLNHINDSYINEINLDKFPSFVNSDTSFLNINFIS